MTGRHPEHVEHGSRLAAGRIAGVGHMGIRISVCLSFATAATLAQPPVPRAALEHCASIRTDTSRLACFDTLVDTARTSPETLLAPDSEAHDTAAPAAASASGIDAFGVEQVEDRGFEIPDEIRSRLVGPFTGWRGNTVFRLENGQVWRQSEQDRLVFQADAPLVTIRRGSFGTYRLSVEGINSSVRVRRIE